jgi:hypothetical protein
VFQAITQFVASVRAPEVALRTRALSERRITLDPSNNGLLEIASERHDLYLFHFLALPSTGGGVFRTLYSACNAFADQYLLAAGVWSHRQTTRSAIRHFAVGGDHAVWIGGDCGAFWRREPPTGGVINGSNSAARSSRRHGVAPGARALAGEGSFDVDGVSRYCKDGNAPKRRTPLRLAAT